MSERSFLPDDLGWRMALLVSNIIILVMLVSLATKVGDEELVNAVTFGASGVMAILVGMYLVDILGGGVAYCVEKVGRHRVGYAVAGAIAALVMYLIIPEIGVYPGEYAEVGEVIARGVAVLAALPFLKGILYPEDVERLRTVIEGGRA